MTDCTSGGARRGRPRRLPLGHWAAQRLQATANSRVLPQLRLLAALARKPASDWCFPGDGLPELPELVRRRARSRGWRAARLGARLGRGGVGRGGVPSWHSSGNRALLSQPGGCWTPAPWLRDATPQRQKLRLSFARHFGGLCKGCFAGFGLPVSRPLATTWALPLSRLGSVVTWESPSRGCEWGEVEV